MPVTQPVVSVTEVPNSMPEAVYGPADATALAKIRRQRGTYSPFHKKTGSPSKDKVKAENNVLSAEVVTLKTTLDEVAVKYQ